MILRSSAVGVFSGATPLKGFLPCVRAPASMAKRGQPTAANRRRRHLTERSFNARVLTE